MGRGTRDTLWAGRHAASQDCSEAREVKIPPSRKRHEKGETPFSYILGGEMRISLRLGVAKCVEMGTA